MPTYFRFGIGPLRFSQRLGQTQAQKKAAARARAQRARQREFSRRHTEVVQYLRTTQGTDCQIGVFRQEPYGDLHLYLRKVAVTVPRGTWVTVTHRSGNLLEIGPAQEPATAAARREAKADHDARTYRAVIAECHIDGINGGSFSIVAEGKDTVHVTVQPDLALRFLSLKNGDIVQVTLARDQAGVEEFWHLSRANGATPRNPASFGPGELTSRPAT
jgi:hypothetical protein